MICDTTWDSGNERYPITSEYGITNASATKSCMSEDICRRSSKEEIRGRGSSKRVSRCETSRSGPQGLVKMFDLLISAVLHMTIPLPFSFKDFQTLLKRVINGYIFLQDGKSRPHSFVWVFNLSCKANRSS